MTPAWWRRPRALALVATLLAFVGVCAIGRVHRVREVDSDIYQRLAHNLVERHAYTLSAAPPDEPEYERMPGYPAFVAAVELVAGPGDYPIIVAHALLHALGVWLMFLLGEALLDDERYGLVAALLWAGFPYAVHFATSIMSETLTATTCLALVCGLVRYDRSGSRAALLLACVAIIVGAYTRPNLLVLPFVFCGVGLLLRRAPLGSRALRGCAILALTVSLALVPWTVHNYRTFHKLSPTSHNYVEYNFCEASVQFRLSPDEIQRFCDRVCPLRNYFDVAAIRRCDPLWLAAAKQELRAHPAAVVGAALLRPLRIWFTWELQGQSHRALQLLLRIVTVALMVPFVLGLVLLWRQSPRGWIPVTTALCIALMHLFLVASARYSMPARPVYVLALALVGYRLVATLMRKVPSRSSNGE